MEAYDLIRIAFGAKRARRRCHMCKFGECGGGGGGPFFIQYTAHAPEAQFFMRARGEPYA